MRWRRPARVTTLAHMDRFDATIGRRALAALVIAPPLAYAVALAWLSGGPAGEALTGGRLLVLLGMAHGLPLAALAWTLTSVAAYSITPGAVVAHSVVRDREYRLAAGGGEPRCERGVVTVEAGGRRIALSVSDPERCRAALARAAAGG